jgi:conjugal transfer mating pair stabilization protein TraG
MVIAGTGADMSNFTIYTIGDIDFVYTAFNGIALIFSSHGSNEWIKFAAYAAAIGLFYKSMKWVLPRIKLMSQYSHG